MTRRQRGVEPEIDPRGRESGQLEPHPSALRPSGFYARGEQPERDAQVDADADREPRQARTLGYGELAAVARPTREPGQRGNAEDAPWVFPMPRAGNRDGAFSREAEIAREREFAHEAELAHQVAFEHHDSPSNHNHGAPANADGLLGDFENGAFIDFDANADADADADSSGRSTRPYDLRDVRDVRDARQRVASVPSEGPRARARTLGGIAPLPARSGRLELVPPAGEPVSRRRPEADTMTFGSPDATVHLPGRDPAVLELVDRDVESVRSVRSVRPVRSAPSERAPRSRRDAQGTAPFPLVTARAPEPALAYAPSAPAPSVRRAPGVEPLDRESFFGREVAPLPDVDTVDTFQDLWLLDPSVASEWRRRRPRRIAMRVVGWLALVFAITMLAPAVSFGPSRDALKEWSSFGLAETQPRTAGQAPEAAPPVWPWLFFR